MFEPSLRLPSLMLTARVPLFLFLLSLALPAAAQLRLDAPLPASAKAGGGGSEFYLEPVTSDGALGFPVGVAAAPDGRLFVAEKNGRVKVVHADGTVPSTPFLDLPDVYPDGDRGLLGVELHPDFPETPWVYVLYSVDDSPQPRPESRSRGYGRLERYRASESNPDVADLSSRQILFGESYEDGIPSCFNSHTIGTVAFGHDGSLFVGAGDGASWAEMDPGGLYPECFGENLVPEEQDQGAFRAQWPASLAGKILRLDPETGEGLADNPFYTGDPTDPESKVWALGLRNPFRFTVGLRDPNQPTSPGELFIGDVGWGSFEEINRARGGENFGWPCREGPRPLPAYASATPPNADLACAEPRAGVTTGPLAYFHHYLPDQSSPGGRVAFSITGGAFWDGDAYPERFQRRLFFADYSTGWVVAAEVNEDGIVAAEEVLSESYGLVDLTQDPVSGLLLAVDIAQQRIVRVQHSGSGVNPPVARAQASLRYGVVPATVEFTSVGTFDPTGGTLTYEWSFGDNTGTTGTRVTHRYDQPGTYGATLTVTSSSGLTAQTTVPVTIGNSMPEITVLQPTSPLVGADGRAPLRAEASDPQESDEDLSVRWVVDLVHNVHEHPEFYVVDGAEGTLVVAPHASEGEVAYYRATAVVTDREGLRAEASMTLREENEQEVEVLVSGDGGEIVLPFPVTAGRAVLRGYDGALPTEGEARVDGEWEAMRYVHALPEVDDVQVLFGAVPTDAIRLEADAPVALAVQVPEEPIVETMNFRAIGSASGQAGSLDGDGFAVGGSGSFEDGELAAVWQPFSGDGIVNLRLDALLGTTASAGLAVLGGLNPGAGGLAVVRTGSGGLDVWTWANGSDARVSASAEGDWLQIRRTRGQLVAFVSADGEEWQEVGRMAATISTDAIAAAVVGGAGGGLAQFSSFAPSDATGLPPAPNSFSTYPFAPNPTTGQSSLLVDAGRQGTYRMTLYDVSGRLVAGPFVREVDTPDVLTFTFEGAGLAVGAYLAQVVHEESGERRVERVTLTR